MNKILWIIVLCLLFSVNAYSLSKCEGDDPKKWTDCEGSYNYPDKKYSGEWKDDKLNGEVIITHPEGKIVKGLFKDGKFIKEI